MVLYLCVYTHRSDALSSIGTALGISGAIFLGEKWRVLDPVAGLIVSLFIVRVAWKLAKPCVAELLEHALPAETMVRIEEIIMSNKEVRSYHKLKTRRVGTEVAIDVHVLLDKHLTFTEAHDVTEAIEEQLQAEFGEGAHINLHAEPIN